MAEAEAKFCFSKPTMFHLSAAILIMWSVCAAEARRCYWCGPLAEQVHRVRSAPACGAAPSAGPITACEPGLAHCAIVATSPPHTESRLCVKLYQDECYPLFCNSSKTWRMTCPCRGDLCNGPNMERESEAFTILAKLVAKTHNSRIMKRTALDDEDVENKSSQTNDQVMIKNAITLQNDTSTTINDDPHTDLMQNIVSKQIETTALDEGMANKSSITNDEVMIENAITLQNDTSTTVNDDPHTDLTQNIVSKQIKDNQVEKTVSDENSYTTQSLQESTHRNNIEVNMQSDDSGNDQVKNTIQSDEPSNNNVDNEMQSAEAPHERHAETDTHSNEPGKEHVKDEVSNESSENVKSENIITQNDNPTQITEIMHVQNDGDVGTKLPATIIQTTLEPALRHILTSDLPTNSDIDSKRLDPSPNDEIKTNPSVNRVLQDKGNVNEIVTTTMSADHKYTSVRGPVTTASSKLQKSKAVTISTDIFVVINWIVLYYFI